MRVSRGLLAILLSGGAAYPAVPKGADIQMTGTFTYLPANDPDLYRCGQPMTVDQVRWRFNHYHRISGPDLHDLYSVVYCGHKGTISIGGHTYTWQNFAASNVLMTTYPDGHDHILAGREDNYRY